jgi:hypothetical protein
MAGTITNSHLSHLLKMLMAPSSTFKVNPKALFSCKARQVLSKLKVAKASVVFTLKDCKTPCSRTIITIPTRYLV